MVAENKPVGRRAGRKEEKEKGDVDAEDGVLETPPAHAFNLWLYAMQK